MLPRHQIKAGETREQRQADGGAARGTGFQAVVVPFPRFDNLCRLDWCSYVCVEQAARAYVSQIPCDLLAC